MGYFRRGVLRVLRGLADGSYDGRIPRAEDMYRLQVETAIYIDRDGVSSSTGRHERPSLREGPKTTDPPAQMTVPLTKQGAEQPNTECNETSGIKPTQQNVFSPLDFLTNSTGFSFGTPISFLTRDEGSSRPPELDGNDTSPLLSMEFMIYNDLLADIGGTAKFFDQDFRNPALFGSASTPSPEVEGAGSAQDVWG